MTRHVRRKANDLSQLELTPLTFHPVFKDYPWGGRNLEAKLGRTIPPGIVAESWEIAGHDHGSTAVRQGPHMGRLLSELMSEWGAELVGIRSAAALKLGRFPLLIKILDAHRWLSVQVHPDDEYSLANEGDFGKTEMWVVLHAEPGSELIYGFKPGVTAASYANALGADRAADELHRLSVHQGDVVFVPAGTVHALGPGIIVAEIQQNSDTTYRIYDWGRPRPIHIEKALDVLNFDHVEPSATIPTIVPRQDVKGHEILASCPHFQTERITLEPGQSDRGHCDGNTFEIWAVLEGTATVSSSHEPVTLHGVDWVLLPANLGDFEVTATTHTTLLRVFVPDVRT